MTASSIDVRPVYAIVGADRFLRHQAMMEVFAAVQDEGDALGPSRFDGDRASVAEVLDEARTLSLTGGRRIVVVDDADGFISTHRASLESYCSSPSETGCLILLCDSLPRNTRLFKAIQEKGRVIGCEPPKGRAMLEWIVERAEKVYSKRIKAAAATVLRDQIGNEPGRLDVELAKLAAYIGERSEIKTEDIGALTGRSREEIVFAVMDSIADGDPGKALQLWEQVWATDRAAPGRAIGGLAWSVRRLLDAKRQVERGADVAQLAGKFFTDSRTLQRRLGRMSTARLEALQHDLLATDLAVKTGASTVEIGIEKLIVKHSTAGAPGGRPRN